MARVRLEILPWLTRAFGSSGGGRLILQEEIADAEGVGDLLSRLASRYPAFGEMAFDPFTRRLTGQVTVIHNGLMLELAEGLATELRDGDNLVLVPSFAGGAEPFRMHERNRTRNEF